MIKAFFGSKKWALYAYGVGTVLLLSLYFQVSLSVEFNEWYGGFYNILQNIQKHTFIEFRQKLFDFTWIAIRYILLATFTSYVTRRYSLWWRESITFDYIPRWRNVTQEIEGASQRIQEDAYRFAKIIESLGLQMTRGMMTLFAFLPILAVLSNGINLSYLHGAPIGHTMWFSIFVSINWVLLWKFAKKECLAKKKLLLENAPVDLCTANRIMAIVTIGGLIAIFWYLGGIVNKISFPETLNLSLVWMMAVGHPVWFGILFGISFVFLWRFIKKEFSWQEIPELNLANKLLTIFTVCGVLTIFWFLGGIINMVLYDKYILREVPISTATLVWLALYVSILGTWISWLVGSRLPGLEYNNQRVEAAFRKELVYGEDDKINHASPETIMTLFTGIRFNYKRLFLHYGYFDLWTNLFYQVMTLLPFLIGGPALFAGAITLGTLIQMDNAFGKVQNSFAIFIDNWTTVTELRSIKKRLNEFEANLDKYQITQGGEK